jgi:glucose-6-phosphate dehydrogenase-like protein OpcA
VTTKSAELLPSGREVPFADIEATLARLTRDGAHRERQPARALTATVVVVGAPDRLIDAADALEQLGEVGGVRAILISEGAHTSPTARVSENSIAIAGIAPPFLNNAVAALRLSSLPAVVWWRGGSIEALDGVADLADRLILDTPEPDDLWSRAAGLFEKTAVTDLRWTRLTRWRAQLAHFFDLPSVRAAAPTIRRLSIEARDLPAARLFAGWLRSALAWSATTAIQIQKTAAEGTAPLECLALEGDGLRVTLAIRPSRTCLEGAVTGIDVSARVVPLADANLVSLLREELAVRTRDLAFERALTAALELRA